MCLSILGTWRGERPGEEWSSAQGLESILISIQSLMSSNPYENEPGYENKKGPDELRHQALYVDKVISLWLEQRAAADPVADSARNLAHRCHPEA